MAYKIESVLLAQKTSTPAYKKAWHTYYRNKTDKFADKLGLMTSKDLDRAGEWRMPIYNVGCFLRERNTRRKEFMKVYTFASDDDAEKFRLFLEELNEEPIAGKKYLLEGVVTSKGR